MKHSKKKKPNKAKMFKDKVKYLETFTKRQEDQLKFHRNLIDSTFKVLKESGVYVPNLPVFGELPKYAQAVIDSYKTGLYNSQKQAEVLEARLQEVRNSKDEWLRYVRVPSEVKSKGDTLPNYSSSN